MCGAGTDVADNRVKGLASAKKNTKEKTTWLQSECIKMV